MVVTACKLAFQLYLTLQLEDSDVFLFTSNAHNYINFSTTQFTQGATFENINTMIKVGKKLTSSLRVRVCSSR